MKTIGGLIAQTRKAKEISLEQLSQETKIKLSFLRDIEKGNWHKLPEFPVLIGFIKNIAHVLEMSEEQALALFRRDYPPREISVSPKPDLAEKRFLWSPRLTFIAVAALAFFTLTGYLFAQYMAFNKPPLLEVYRPSEGEMISEDSFIVTGRSEEDTSVKVNNQPAYVEEDGAFTAEIEISEQTTTVKVIATSRSGKTSEIVRTIRPSL